MRDPAIPSPRALEESLTPSFLQFVAEPGRFRAVRPFDGRLTADDLLLRLSFDRFEQRRRIHPVGLPGALLTATLYIWAGGPIFLDRSLLAGRLIVEEVTGAIIADVQAHVER